MAAPTSQFERTRLGTLKRELLEGSPVYEVSVSNQRALATVSTSLAGDGFDVEWQADRGLMRSAGDLQLVWTADGRLAHTSNETQLGPVVETCNPRLRRLRPPRAYWSR